VGSYNFFDSGTLTANTTVSFASVPTNANWRYSFKPELVAVPWDISTAIYLQNFSVSAQETNPKCVFFKPDGLKMYVLGTSDNDVNEYDLSTAWDISTASYLQLFSVAAQEAASEGIFFKPDGTKMYVVGAAGDDVNEYNLSTAWDISTASYLQLFSVSAQDTAPTGIFFKPDGLKMYIVGDTGDNVNEYDLSTAWNISTASYLQLFSVASQEINPSGIFFKPDGTKMYVVGDAGNDINEYNLSTAWDISTAVYLQNFYVFTQDSTPQGVFFKPDGTKMYVMGTGGVDVNEYDLGYLSTVTLPAAVENTPLQTLGPDTRVTYDFFTMDGGTTVTLIGEEVI
jgi:DNA-binding beta-propeller fold protein YncE